MFKKICLLLASLALVACATTTEQPLSDFDTVSKSGFLTDYSLLKPGKDGEARLRYVRPNTDWKSYTGIFLEPVVFISDASSKVDAREQQILTSYYYNTLKTHLATVLPMVDHQGPHVLVVRAALTNVTSSTPGLRTISLIIPQARLLDAGKDLATGSYAFVGTAQSEGEVTDGGTGQILLEAVDGRAGGESLKDVSGGEWGDAQKAMEYWADLAAKRLGNFTKSGQGS